ncbi:unnamed protein product [Dovyalis caffra]|uniref:Uncharacterized protein n=1 Tax=Dovyalis caffra TaxID=77055 RepID=A0AAV1S7C1_9ROSI|nr:unnamed protein product [Dovyalis caffra]
MSSGFPSFFDPFNKKNKKDVAKKFDLISHSFDEFPLYQKKEVADGTLDGYYQYSLISRMQDENGLSLFSLKFS